MSYRLIDSNEIAIKYPEVNDMPCIYADIPNGLNGDFYDLSVYPKIVETFEQPTVCDLEQIRAEIEQLRMHKAQYLTSDGKVCIDSQAVLDILDKHKTGSEDKADGDSD